MAQPFIPNQQYVAPSGAGYTVQGPSGSQYYGSQAEAEAAYNQQFPDPTAQPAATAPGAPSGYNTGLALGQMGYQAALERLNRLEIPQFEWQKQFSGEQLGQQESQYARSLGLSQQQFEQLKAYQNALLAQQNQQIGLQGRQLGIQETLGRGQLGLGALGLASQEALGRQGLGLSAAQAADQAALARANLVLQSGGPANAFQQQAALYGLRPNGTLGLGGLLSGEGAPAAFQAPQAPLEAQTAEGIDRQIGGGLYGPNAAPQLMNQLAASSINQPYTSPSAQAALALGGANAEYATPGSALSQIPGIGQRYLDAATALSSSNYGVVSDPQQLTAGIDRLVRANPEWQKASQTGDFATKQRIERQGFAQAAGLPEDLVAPIYAQTEAYRQQHGGETMPMEQVAQLVQGQAGALKQRKLTAVARETLGLDEAGAQKFVQDWQNQFNTTGTLPNPADLDRDIARRYGYGGTPTVGAPGYGAPALPGQGAAPGGTGYGENAPGRMNYSTAGGAGNEMYRMDPAQAAAAQARYGPGPAQPIRTATDGAPRMMYDQRPPAVGQGAVPGFGGSGGYQAPSTVDQAQQFLSALPQTNQINARNFFHADPASQQFTLSALRFRGEDPTSALRTLQQALPKSTATPVGMVL